MVKLLNYANYILKERDNNEVKFDKEMFETIANEVCKSFSKIKFIDFFVTKTVTIRMVPIMCDFA